MSVFSFFFEKLFFGSERSIGLLHHISISIYFAKRHRSIIVVRGRQSVSLPRVDACCVCGSPFSLINETSHALQKSAENGVALVKVLPYYGFCCWSGGSCATLGFRNACSGTRELRL